MKKSLIAVLVVLCFLWVTGCSGQSEKEASFPSTLSNPSQSKEVSSAPSAPQEPSSPSSALVETSSTQPMPQESDPLVSSPPQEEGPLLNSFFNYFEFCEYKDETTEDMVQYLFHKPLRKTNEPMPLVIFLHGKGDSVSLDYFGTAGPMVDALMELENESEEYGTYTLVPITPFSYEGDWTYSQVETLKALLPKIVEQYNIDPKRVYVSGISMGGFMTCRLVSEMPDFFAAAVPLSGSLLIDFPWLVLGTSFRIYHVATDSVVEVGCSRRLHEQLSYYNHPNLTYVEYETGDHISPLYTVFTQDREGFFSWLFAQRLHKEYNWE